MGWKRRALRWGLGTVGVLLALTLLAYGFLRGGAPRLDGSVKLGGLSAPVTVTRDALGVPTITAADHADAARALGFLHAQDRFFQMDLMRRLAAGELSALVGAAAVEFDEQHRLFRLRETAKQVLARATPAQRSVLQAYAAGVNAGLKALGTWPFEYGLLMQKPQPWQPEDSVLVIYAMYFDLQGGQARHESDLALMHSLLPPPLYRFLSAPGTQWDAPLTGKAVEQPPIPGADVIDLRKIAPKVADSDWQESDDDEVVGSNNWAVSGAHTPDGAALLANDMHLGLKVPNTWYRAQLNYRDTGEAVQLTGLTLPGVPALVAGSNGHVAWGFTNSYGDWTDLVLLHINPDDADEYMTPEGWQHFEHHSETIRVKGGKDARFEIRDTVWGPVLDKDQDGVTRAVHWIAADPGATDFALAELDKAKDVREAMAVGNGAGMPEQNFVSADSAGHVAWTISGRIPLRRGYDPTLPAYWDTPGTGWQGWLAPAQYPRVVDPADGRVWSANARVVDGAMLAAIGDGGYDLGARATQIRDDLRIHDKFAPADMLAIQLDDRALFLARWRSVLLGLLNPQRLANHPERAEFRRYVEDWGGQAAVGSVGYRLVRGFRREVEQAALAPLFAACTQADPHFDFHRLSQLEAPLWALMVQQPKNLLDPRYKDWDALLLAAVDKVDAELRDPKAGLAAATWGARNVVQVRHPLSGALPFLAGFLDMEPVSLPGDSDMPRVQGEDFGASERMAVAPGHEAEGILEMPAGQSGWPLSPFYRNSQPAWAAGQATPLLPGATMHTLVLESAEKKQ